MTCLSNRRQEMRRREKKIRIACLLLFPSTPVSRYIFSFLLSHFVLFRSLSLLLDNKIIPRIYALSTRGRERKENKQVLIIVVIRKTHHILKNQRRNARNSASFSFSLQRAREGKRNACTYL